MSATQGNGKGKGNGNDDPGLGGAYRPVNTEKAVPIERAPVTPTDFNPFAALGLDAATANLSMVRPAFLRSLRHRHESTIIRFPATANAFPSQVQVQQAYDYLTANGNGTRIEHARARWAAVHVDVFFPTFPPGHDNVFRAVPASAAPSGSGASGARAASASAAAPGARATSGAAFGAGAHAASASGGPSTPAGFGSARPFGRPPFGSSGSSGFHHSGSARGSRARASSGFAERPTKSARTSGTGFGSSPATGSSHASGTADDPVTFSDEDDQAPPVSPTPGPRPRPFAAPRAASAASASAGAAPPPVPAGPAPPPRNASATVARPAPAPGPVGAATGAAAAARGPRGGNRSGGNATRNVSVVNPVTDQRVTVGTWSLSVGATPNAVVAGFDARGRIFYRITNLDLNGHTVVAPTATATRFEDVDFRGPYQGMDATAVRAAVDRDVRLPAHQRP
jgi:hypothetical protein